MLGPFLSESISAYKSVEEAKAAFEDFTAAANDCPEFTDDEDREFTISPMSFPAYGDESFAVRMNVDGFPADAVQVRVGDVMLSVIQMGMSTDIELQQTIVEEALSKLDH